MGPRFSGQVRAGARGTRLMVASLLRRSIAGAPGRGLGSGAHAPLQVPAPAPSVDQ